MDTSEQLIYKYDWGAPVNVSACAPNKYLSVTQGSICGFRVLDTESSAGDFGEPVGTVLYLVEGGEGDAIEIPEQYLSTL